MLCTATQDQSGHIGVTVESSDKKWSTGRGNGKPLQYSCCENSINCIKKQKDVTQKDEPLGWKVSIILLGKSRGQLLIASERVKEEGGRG